MRVKIDKIKDKIILFVEDEKKDKMIAISKIDAEMELDRFIFLVSRGLKSLEMLESDS